MRIAYSTRDSFSAFESLKTERTMKISSHSARTRSKIESAFIFPDLAMSFRIATPTWPRMQYMMHYW
jgi:hypothetical protein